MSDSRNFDYEEQALILASVCVPVIVYHPFELAEFLIQIGHQPMPGYPMKTLFGIRNTVKYLRYIRERDGLSGLKRGLLSTLRAGVIYFAVEVTVDHLLKGQEEEEEVEEQDFWSSLYQFGISLIKDVVVSSIAIVASQPFYIISWRVMGQFVGREELYSGFLRSVIEIYSRCGVTGFFTGLVPRWLGEILALIMAKFINYLIQRFFVLDPLVKASTIIIVQHVCYALTYPFTVTSKCFCLNDCGLACGEPPHMPKFHSWFDTWKHLRSKGRLYSKAGSAVIQTDNK